MLRLPRVTTLVLAVLAFVVGGLAGWWIAMPPEPWMRFDRLNVVFMPTGQRGLHINGTYDVARSCQRNGAPAPIWRGEATSVNGKLSRYGPNEKIPDLTAGPHTFYEFVETQPGVNPLEGEWIAQLMVTCPGETPETVLSRRVPIEIMIAP
jgi:hypothetical protein